MNLFTKLSRFSFRKLYVIAYSRTISRRFHSCGRGLRLHAPAIIQSPEKIDIGDDVSIGTHAWLNCVPNSKNVVSLSIGSRCRIGRFAHINAYESVVLEDDVLLADRVHISDCSHEFSDPDVPITGQPATFQGPVVIRRGAWIGVGAVILPGVTVGRNAVVGANAVVTSSVPDDYVAVGVPARNRAKSAREPRS